MFSWCRECKASTLSTYHWCADCGMDKRNIQPEERYDADELRRMGHYDKDYDDG